MNKLVDGFQIAGGRAAGAGGIGDSDDGAIPGRADSTPIASSSPSSGPAAADARTTPSSRSNDSESRRAGGGLGGGPSAVHGVESFASAQLGFRRGLEGLLADRTGGGGGGASGSRARARYGGSRSWMPEDILEGAASGDDGDSEAHGGSSNRSRSSKDGGGSGSSGSDRRGSAGGATDATAGDTLSAFAEQLLGGGGGGGDGRVTSFESTSVGGLRRDGDGSESIEKQIRNRYAERSAERSAEVASTGWEETKGEGGQHRGGWTEESGTDEGRGRSLSSSMFSGDSSRAEAAGRRGGAGARGGSMTSSSSTSFGPDLEAEIATLEALADSLKQRKMRFEPKVSSTYGRMCFFLSRDIFFRVAFVGTCSSLWCRGGQMLSMW